MKGGKDRVSEREKEVGRKMKTRGKKNKCRKGDEERYEREQRVKGCMDEVADRG